MSEIFLHAGKVQVKPAFIIQNRNKAEYVGRAVRGALEQTVPCEIIISDQGSTDGSLQVIRDAVSAFGPTHHNVRILECPVRGAYGMLACNSHLQWCVEQLQREISWVFQCSADDYSLPDRVKVCMETVDSLSHDHDLVGIANTMYFENPGETNRESVSGYPRQSGWVKAGEGLAKLAYGSTIWAYRRDWLLKVGMNVACTLDVYLGYLAALEGLYCVASPQHVHCTAAGGTNQMGFQGKMRGASGDELWRLAELNHFQLLQLYQLCEDRARELHPGGIPDEDWHPLVEMILGQARAWVKAREVLHAAGITPGVM